MRAFWVLSNFDKKKKNLQFYLTSCPVFCVLCQRVIVRQLKSLKKRILVVALKSCSQTACSQILMLCFGVIDVESFCNGWQSQDQALSQHVQRRLQLHPVRIGSGSTLFLPDVKRIMHGEGSTSVTFDLTTQANLTISTVIPKLNSSGILHFWQPIKDAKAT